MKFSEKTLAALVSIFVLLAFAWPSLQGFAVAESCTGTPVLTLTPNPVQVGQQITAKVSGLKNCFGAEVLIKEGDMCGGDAITSYLCRGVNCEGSAVFTVRSTRDYVITACIDRDGDNYFLTKNERAPSILKVTSLPDLAVDKLEFTPKTIFANEPLVAEVTISNKGVAAARGFTTKYEIFRENEKSAFYIYNTRNEETSAILYFRQQDLQPGESTQLKLPAVSLAAGTYKIKITLDAEKRFEEPDRTNNVFETTLTVI